MRSVISTNIHNPVKGSFFIHLSFMYFCTTESPSYINFFINTAISFFFWFMDNINLTYFSAHITIKEDEKMDFCAVHKIKNYAENKVKHIKDLDFFFIF